MPDTIRIYTHNGNPDTPYFAIYVYAFGTTRVERWSYIILDKNKNPASAESEKSDNGKRMELEALDAVGGTEYDEAEKTS